MKLAWMGLLLGATMATAGVQAHLETPVEYLPEASVVKSVKDECKVEEMLEQRVGRIMGRINRGEGTIAAGSEKKDGKVLRLKIARVMGVGGGAYSGPKSITVVAELLEGDKVVRQTRLNRWSIGGFWAGFRGTCSILNRCAVAISKDLGRWVKDPSYAIKEEADAKDESAQEDTEPKAEPKVEPEVSTPEAVKS